MPSCLELCEWGNVVMADKWGLSPNRPWELQHLRGVSWEATQGFELWLTFKWITLISVSRMDCSGTREEAGKSFKIKDNRDSLCVPFTSWPQVQPTIILLLAFVLTSLKGETGLLSMYINLLPKTRHSTVLGKCWLNEKKIY